MNKVQTRSVYSKSLTKPRQIVLAEIKPREKMLKEMEEMEKFFQKERERINFLHTLTEQIKAIEVEAIIDTQSNNSSFENNRELLATYIQIKDETDSYKKGKLFEEFLVNLFKQVGFQFIQNRVTDLTSETDLVLRNDIDDTFLSKFGKYIFVEAKNRVSKPVDKNDFLALRAKIDSSNQLCELGIIVAAHDIASTVRLEALRTSRESGKILLFANKELTRLITANDKLSELKKLIDEQIKDVPVN